MEVPVKELVGEYVAAVSVPARQNDEDVFLQGLVDDFQSGAAMFKRDMRRLLEKDPVPFLWSACRVLKAKQDGLGAEYLMESMWGNPLLAGSLIDPALLPLAKAISFAKRWAAYDPMLDIKLLHMGFPTDGGAVCDIDIVRAKRVLSIVSELPPSRHILFPLVSLLRSPDPAVRSMAASLYGRTSGNAEWVRSRLEEPDARVRANAVESLWGADSSAARTVLKEASRDRNHRVAANALIGLHQGGNDVTASLQKMCCETDPLARAAAAFAMGRILNPHFIPVLEHLVKDENPRVRSQALRALIRIRRHQRPAAAPDPEAAAPPVEAEQSPAATQPADPSAEPTPPAAAAEPSAVPDANATPV
jgi:hypothetical protein